MHRLDTLLLANLHHQLYVSVRTLVGSQAYLRQQNNMQSKNKWGLQMYCLLHC